jgi:2-hydroxy-3-keto-5-methylthiopentenyl-1-phosphate phosphatase
MKIPEKKIPHDFPDSYEYRLLFMIFKKFDALVKDYGGKFYVVFSHKKPETFMLGHYLEKENIEYIDIFSYVNDHRTKEAHFPVDGHWNEYGHYLVARGFFEVIRDRYL